MTINNLLICISDIIMSVMYSTLGRIFGQTHQLNSNSSECFMIEIDNGKKCSFLFKTLNPKEFNIKGMNMLRSSAAITTEQQ